MMVGRRAPSFASSLEVCVSIQAIEDAFGILKSKSFGVKGE